MKAGGQGNAGIDFRRWERVLKLGEELTAADVLPALSLCVVHQGHLSLPVSFGRRHLADASSTVDPSDRFVVASLTKPIVAMGILSLVESGRLALNDRVVEIIPEFRDAAKRPTTVRHLLTHTSGLPDSLPNNFALRQAHAPLSEFVKGACEIGLDFPPGRGVQYQSLGYAFLGEIIERLTSRSCGEFLRTLFFEPLRMNSTSLGLESAGEKRPIAEIRVPPEMAGGEDWNWNSPYWRALGAPWGGIVSTARDLARFCAMMLGGGELEGVRVLSPAAVQAATTNQLTMFHDLPEADRRTRPWGFGWRMNWGAHPACFCDLLPAEAYGHWGATGTLFWINPQNSTAAVILSSQPTDRDRSPLIRVSNAIAASLH